MIKLLGNLGYERNSAAAKLALGVRDAALDDVLRQEWKTTHCKGCGREIQFIGAEENVVCVCGHARPAPDLRPILVGEANPYGGDPAGFSLGKCGTKCLPF